MKVQKGDNYRKRNGDKRVPATNNNALVQGMALQCLEFWSEHSNLLLVESHEGELLSVSFTRLFTAGSFQAGEHREAKSVSQQGWQWELQMLALAFPSWKSQIG